MKVLLLHPDRDFDFNSPLREPFRRDPLPDWRAQLMPAEKAFVQDLELETLLRAMAGDDEFLHRVTRRALLSAFRNDPETILYRQRALKDCLKNSETVRTLYELAFQTIEGSRKQSWGLSSHFPSSMLYNGISTMEFLLGRLKTLREFSHQHRARFESEAFTRLFEMLVTELNEDYLTSIDHYLEHLKFRRGILITAELGEWSESVNFVLRLVRGKDPNWFQRLMGRRPPGYTFRLHERDEAGSRILGDMRQRAIGRVAVALAESADHVLSFFHMLRTELAFYVGCLRLYDQLAAKEEPTCFPAPTLPGTRRHSSTGLYDVCLSLRMPGRVVGNATAADNKNLVIITGANQGGKSSFLRSIGLAQVMMQSGMFVPAQAFRAELCPGLLTHYKREEDAAMESGKLDEELARMSAIAERLGPNSIVLFNESFAATNEREGSEIARQVVDALLAKHVKVFFVTHLYEFAHGFYQQKMDDALFLRPERHDDGTRTFRMLAGEPLQTSYGEDLYKEVFTDKAIELSPNL